MLGSSSTLRTCQHFCGFCRQVFGCLGDKVVRECAIFYGFQHFGEIIRGCPYILQWKNEGWGSVILLWSFTEFLWFSIIFEPLPAKKLGKEENGTTPLDPNFQPLIFEKKPAWGSHNLFKDESMKMVTKIIIF